MPTYILGCILLSQEEECIRSLPCNEQGNSTMLAEATPDLHQGGEQTAAHRAGKEKSKIQNGWCLEQQGFDSGQHHQIVTASGCAVPF